MKYLHFIFLLSIFFPRNTYSQSNGGDLNLYAITEENGLSDNHVQCILKDSHGFIWVGTADGLNLMDGSGITVYKHSLTDSNSLLSNNIVSLAMDGSKNIWIGTVAGLSCYNSKEKKFSSAVPPAGPYGSSVFIASIVIDKRGRIWCGSTGGLYLFEPLQKKFYPYFIDAHDDGSNNTLSNRITHVIHDSSKDKLWLSTNDGVWSFDLSSLSYKREIGAHNEPSYKPLFPWIYQSSDNKIWAGNWGNGLLQLDPNTGQVHDFQTSAGHPLVVKSINEIKKPDGSVILLVDGKLNAFDPLTRSFFKYPQPLQLRDVPDVLPAYRSDDGWLWLASSTGLYIYDPQRQFFQHHFFSEPITAQTVVMADWEQDLLIGGEGKYFLKQYDNAWNEKRDFRTVTLENKSASALSFAKKSSSEFLIANSAGVVDIINNGRTYKWFQHKDGDGSSLPRDFVTHLFYDSKKILWVFPWREGIWQMDTATGACKKYCDGFITENGKVKKLVIVDAVEDKNGNIWMTDYDEGIILYERSSGKFSKPFTAELGERCYTSSIYYANGNLYSATNYVLLNWNADSMHLHITQLPPEMNKEIYNVCLDKKGNLWIATKSGLVVYNSTAGSFQRFTSSDGLVNNDMNGSLFCRSNGLVLFGTERYITSFDPDKTLKSVSSSSPVKLTGIFSNDRSIASDSASTLHFSYRENNIVFKWALPEFSDPLHNQYYCRLEGIDADWRYVGNKGEIQYANLSPGAYTIQLKAQSANGIASNNIITIPFVIDPPLWKKTWFILIAGIILIAIFFAVVRYISRRNLKEKLLRLEKEQAVEKERNRISRDMHDDLGSGLTKIAIMSEVVKKQLNDPAKAKQQLEHISESSRELVDNLQDIIWILNPKNDNLGNLAAYIREYALKFFEPFHIETHFDYPEPFPELKLSEEKRRNIFLTVKESFNNIVKHAWCSNVYVNITSRQLDFVISIRDDGKGFNKADAGRFGNGLVNMKGRMEQIGGTYVIESSPGGGTITTLSVLG